jgi:hypothetical protein
MPKVPNKCGRTQTNGGFLKGLEASGAVRSMALRGAQSFGRVPRGGPGEGAPFPRGRGATPRPHVSAEPDHGFVPGTVREERRVCARHRTGRFRGLAGGSKRTRSSPGLGPLAPAARETKTSGLCQAPYGTVSRPRRWVELEASLPRRRSNTQPARCPVALTPQPEPRSIAWGLRRSPRMPRSRSSCGSRCPDAARSRRPA